MVVMRDHLPDERPVREPFVGGDLSGRFFKCGLYLVDTARGDPVRLTWQVDRVRSTHAG